MASPLSPRAVSGVDRGWEKRRMGRNGRRRERHVDSSTLENHSGGCRFPLHPSRGLRFLNSSSISFLSLTLLSLGTLSLPFKHLLALFRFSFPFPVPALLFISPLSLLYLSISLFSLSLSSWPSPPAPCLPPCLLIPSPHPFFLLGIPNQVLRRLPTCLFAGRQGRPSSACKYIAGILQ